MEQTLRIQIEKQPVKTMEHPSFKCNLCEKVFPKWVYLKKHLKRHASKENWECEHCRKIFSTKFNLTRHVEVHNRCDKKKYGCNDCGDWFRNKVVLMKHIQTHMPFQGKKTLKCVLCEFSSTTKLLKAHYATEHNLPLRYEELTFASKLEFDKWLRGEETREDSLMHFVIRNSYKTKKRHQIVYNCHRSGTYSDGRSSDERKRALKFTGYKNINGTCPAEIKLSIHLDGTCDVVYQSTHVQNEQHTCLPKQELEHIFIDKEDCERITDKISKGVPAHLIQVLRTYNC